MIFSSAMVLASSSRLVAYHARSCALAMTVRGAVIAHMFTLALIAKVQCRSGIFRNLVVVVGGLVLLDEARQLITHWLRELRR